MVVVWYSVLKSNRLYITSRSGLGVMGLSDGDSTVYTYNIGSLSNHDVWQWPGAGTGGGPATNLASSLCLDVYDWAGPLVDGFTCNGGSNQKLSLNADGTISEPNSLPDGGGGPKCLVVSPNPSCSNVWGRRLSQGHFALGFVNNGDAATTITCDAACFQLMGVKAGTYTVRDIWAHEVVGTVAPPYSFSAPVNGIGFAALFRLTPS